MTGDAEPPQETVRFKLRVWLNTGGAEDHRLSGGR